MAHPRGDPIALHNVGIECRIKFPQNLRKILVPVKFLSAILGPETAAPILWVPGICALFPQENPHVHKSPRFRGGGTLGLGGGGGSADFIFMGEDFSENQRCRAKIALHPPKSRCRTFLWTSLSYFPLIRNREGARAGVAAGWWRVLRHFWVPKTDRATRGVSQLQLHQSRCSVQLSH